MTHQWMPLLPNFIHSDKPIIEECTGIIEKRVLNKYIEKNYIKYMLLTQCFIDENISKTIMSFIFPELNVCNNDYDELSFSKVNIFTKDVKIVDELDKLDECDVLVINICSLSIDEIDNFTTLAIAYYHPTFILHKYKSFQNCYIIDLLDETKIYFNGYKINKMKCKKADNILCFRYNTRFFIYFERMYVN